MGEITATYVTDDDNGQPVSRKYYHDLLLCFFLHFWAFILSGTIRATMSAVEGLCDVFLWVTVLHPEKQMHSGVGGGSHDDNDTHQAISREFSLHRTHYNKNNIMMDFHLAAKRWMLLY